MSSIARALDVLSAVVDRPGGAALREISEGTGLAKPTAHRIVQTLVARGMVRQNPDRSYVPGSALLALSGQALTTVDYGEQVRPSLRRLHKETAETVHFGVLVGSEAVYAVKIEGRRPYRMASQVGKRLSLSSTSIGKSILAFLPEPEREELLAENPPEIRTKNTITDAQALARELARVRERGYAIDDEENEADIRCVGAAVFSAQASVIGGISISAPAFQLTRKRAASLAPVVRATANKASVALGAPPSILPTKSRSAKRERPDRSPLP
jgi:IclR family acetate operon transcriptional repressor